MKNEGEKSILVAGVTIPLEKLDMMRDRYIDLLKMRLGHGAVEYKNAFPNLPVSLEEFQQEILDIAGWGYVMWLRVEMLKQRAREIDG